MKDFEIPAKPLPRVNLTVRLPPALVERLRRLAKAKQSTVGRVVEVLLTAGLDRAERP